jgi:hypothetical protein
VSLTLANNDILACVGLRLFLPEVWGADAERHAKCNVFTNVFRMWVVMGGGGEPQQQAYPADVQTEMPCRFPALISPLFSVSRGTSSRSNGTETPLDISWMRQKHIIF